MIWWQIMYRMYFEGCCLCGVHRWEEDKRMTLHRTFGERDGRSCRRNKTENENEVVSNDVVRLSTLQWKQRNLVSERKDKERLRSLSFPFFRGRRWMIWLAYYKAEEDDEVVFIRCVEISKTQWMKRHHMRNIKMWTESMSHRLNHPFPMNPSILFFFLNEWLFSFFDECVGFCCLMSLNQRRMRWDCMRWWQIMFRMYLEGCCLCAMHRWEEDKRMMLYRTFGGMVMTRNKSENENEVVFIDTTRVCAL